MSSIPLPALSIKPQEQPDTLTNLSNLLHVKSQLQGQQLQGLQTQEAQINLDNARKQQLEDKTIRDSYRKNAGDLEATIKDAAATGNVSPGTLTKLQETHLKIQTDLATKDEKTLKNALDSGNLFAGALDAVKQVPLENRQQAVQAQLQRLSSQGVDVSSVLKTVQSLPDLSDDTLNGVESSLLGHNKAVEQEMKRREVVATESKNKREADEFAAKMPGGAMQPVDQKELSAYLANPKLDSGISKDAATFAAWKAKQAPLANFNLQMQAGGGLSKEALDQQAENYYNTGKLPPGGRGAAGIAQNRAIMNRAAELHSGQSLAESSAEYAANKESLKKLQTNFDNVSAFENTAIKNLDQVARAGANIPDLSARFANVPVRMLSEKLVGTPEMARFKTALLTAQTEAAKVLSSANASGVLSDSARHETQEILDGNLSFPAMMASINQLKTDFGNRHQSYADQIADIKGRIGGKANPSGPSRPAGATHTGVGSADKKKHWLDASGKDLGLAE